MQNNSNISQSNNLSRGNNPNNPEQQSQDSFPHQINIQQQQQQQNLNQINSKIGNQQEIQEDLKSSDIKKNLDAVYDDRDKMNEKYIELLEKEQNLRFQLWRQQIDTLKEQQNHHLNPDKTYNKNMGMIAHLTNNTLPVIQNPFNQYFAQHSQFNSPLQQTPMQGQYLNTTGNFNTGQQNNNTNNQTHMQQQLMTQQYQTQTEKYQKEIQEKEYENFNLKEEMKTMKLQYQQIFQQHNQSQQERFQQLLKNAEEENVKLKRFYELEIEKKNKELQTGEKLCEELSLRLKKAIEQKDQEMQEFMQYKYIPLQNKVEDLKQDNIMTENKANLQQGDILKKQQDEMKKMQIFIMSQQQELDNLRNTCKEYDQLRRTHQIPFNIQQSKIQGSGHQDLGFQNENQTLLLQKLDNLQQLLDLERKKNQDLRDNQQNMAVVNRQLFPDQSDGKDGQSYQEINAQLRRENEALKLLVADYEPYFIRRRRNSPKKQQIDTDKMLISQNNKKNIQNDDIDKNSSYLSIHSESLQHQQTPFQKASQFGNNVDDNDDFYIDEPECLKENNKLRQYLTDLIRRNEQLQMGLEGQINPQMNGGNTQIVQILQEKLEQMKEKYQRLQIDNKQLKDALQQQFQNESLLNSQQGVSLNNSLTNVNAKNVNIQNQKLKALLQVKINEAEENKVKAMRFDQLEQENQILQSENNKLRMQGNIGASQNQYGAQMQVKDIELRYQIQQNEIIKLTNALREKMQEVEHIKAQSINIQKHAKENIFNMERSYRDNFGNMEKSFREQQNKAQQINQELDKVTNVLRGKMKESDELKAAISQFDNLMKEKNFQNDQLAKKCQQLAQALQEKINNENRVQEVMRQNQQLRQDMERLTNALKEKLRENENIKSNFKKLEGYLKEREAIEGELRRMKDVVDQKLRENGEWRNRCNQMEGKVRQTQELEGKMRDLQGKMRFIIQEIQSIPNKVGGLGGSSYY